MPHEESSSLLPPGIKTTLYRNRHSAFVAEGPVVAAIGNMDGVHLGHQALLKRVVEAKEAFAASGKGRALAVAISFYPHPAVVLRPGKESSRITNVRQKLAVLSALGVDALMLMHFTKAFAMLPAAEFVEKELLNRLNVCHLVMGADARVGFGGDGGAEFIASMFKKQGRSAEILPFVEEAGARISSGRVRKLVHGGMVEQAPALLGRNYAVEGRVVEGDRRGRTIGFPTANMRVPRHIIPANGVYVSRAELHGKMYGGVTNIGVRPTFSGSAVSIETHFLDYGGASLYGERVELEFVARIRDEVRFASAADLIRQIEADVTKAKNVLGR